MTFEQWLDTNFVRVTKTGYSGHDYLPGDVLSGTAQVDGVLTSEAYPQWHFRVDLKSEKGVTSSMSFELSKVGDELYGTWEYVDDVHSEVVDGVRVSTTYGAVRAQSASTHGGRRVVLGAATRVPCPVCCDMVFRCGDQGPGGCNESQTCRYSCPFGGKSLEPRQPFPMLACLPKGGRK